jgi:uncharacterized protein DUF2800
MPELPAPHSPLGASSAERWMNCPGSVRLIELLQSLGGSEHADDPDWRRDGITAHALAADCLNEDTDAYEGDPEKYPLLDENMMAAVQVHLNYVRSKPGWQFAELKMHRPEFHEQMYGTTDVAVLDPEHLEIIDYKHGVGIVVEVEENPQIMYYAFMVIDELGSAWDDDCPITLTIVQPRVEWRDPIRSWPTTVGYIRAWARDILKPAMDRCYTDNYLSPGEHCRFCPAKLLCPAFLSVANRASRLTLEEIQAMNEPVLGHLLESVKVIKMAPAMIQGEARGRVVNQRKIIPGWKIVKAKGDRVWKENAPVAERFGFQPQKVKSPAQVEDEPGGKKFVAEYAFAPDTGFDIVPVSDRRKEVVIETAAEKWAVFIENLKDR